MDKLGPLRMFVQVAQRGSFSRAAQATGASRAALSAGVAQLEQELGTRLLQRTTRSVQLTPDGQLLLEKANQLLADAEAIDTLFHRAPEQLVGRVTLDMPSRMARNLVIPAVPGLLKKYPKLELCIRSADRMVDLVGEGVDCAIRVGALADSRLVARRLGAFQLVNCASPEYLAAYGEPRQAQDLSQHWLIGYATAGEPQAQTFDYLDGDSVRTVPMRHRLVVNTTEAYAAACLAGLGLIQVPRYSVQNHLSSGALVEVMAQFHDRPLPVHAIFPHRRHRPTRVQTVVDWITELITPHLQSPPDA